MEGRKLNPAKDRKSPPRRLNPFFKGGLRFNQITLGKIDETILDVFRRSLRGFIDVPAFKKRKEKTSK